jgi:hypothetical protein
MSTTEFTYTNLEINQQHPCWSLKLCFVKETVTKYISALSKLVNLIVSVKFEVQPLTPLISPVSSSPASCIFTPNATFPILNLQVYIHWCPITLTNYFLHSIFILLSQKYNNSSTVVCISRRENMFTESLPSRDRGGYTDTKAARWSHKPPLIFSK